MDKDALLHKCQDQLDKLDRFTDDLGWEYDRLSSSGQETLDKIYIVLGKDTIPEQDMEILRKEQQKKEKDDGNK
tara:strand:+ start:833 stop:1054 length:222 start_codon:yes stop_codon:yes gene_type:complete